MKIYKAWSASIGFSIIAASVFFIAPAFAATPLQVPGTYPTIQSAVDAAVAGDIIEISGTQVVTSPIVIDKQLTIRGTAGAEIDTTGGSYVFVFNPGSEGSELKSLTLFKTDTVSDDAMVSVNANSITIDNNTFKSVFNIGDGQIVRGIVVSGVTGLDVHNNTFTHLRQPGYVNNATGVIHDNEIDNSKGWVVVSESNITFTNNTWDNNQGDIAIIKDVPYLGVDNYSDIVAISNANNGAVVEDQTLAPALLSVSYVKALAAPGGNGTQAAPYQTIQAGVDRVIAGGTVRVQSGSYSGAINVTKNGVKIVGESEGGVMVNLNAATPFGQGVSISGVTGVSLSNMSFAVPAGAPVSYALQAYKADGLTLTDVSFAGPGKTSTHIGGVDVNTTNNVTYNNVSATAFYKNGFSFTSRYAPADAGANGITFNNISSTNNGWTGISFYTMNGSNTAGASISGVQFTGTNTVSGNGEGIFVEGDTDANHIAHNAPAYTVTSDGATLDLAHVAFGAGNVLYDIENYQTAPVNAIGATFGGVTGDAMTGLQRTAEDGRIYDHLDAAALGLVTYYTYANDPSQSNFVGSPSYVRSNNSGDTAATAMVPAQATATRFRFTDGTNTYSDVAGVEHVQAGQFPVPSTGQHQYRVGVSAAMGAYTVTGEYEVNGTWYPITGSATVYVVDSPTGSFVFPTSGHDVFRPSDNPARVSADDANDSFRDVVFNVDGATYQVNRAQCDLREAGHRVLCDVSESSAWTGSLADGTHAVSATLYNKASNHTALAGVNFTVDSSGPVVTNFVINPAASVYTDAIGVSADATDADSGIKNISFFITAPRAGDGVCDGNGAHLADSQVTTPTSGTTYSASLDTSGLSGAYCVDVVAENLASGHSLPQKISVTIDNANTAPTVPTLLSPADGSTLGTNEFDFTWNPSTDAQSDAITYQYQASQDSAQIGGVLTNGLWTSPAPLTTPMIHSSGAGDGTWYWQVRAQDAVGNWSGWSNIWSVKLDTASAPAPTPGVTTNDASPITSTDATLNGTNGDIAADNTSFWWGTTAPAGPFTAAADPSTQLPSGWAYHPTGTGAQSIGSPFSYALTGLVPNTTYYFVAWSQVGGVWYPGSVLSFVTSEDSAPSTSGAVTTNAANPIGLTDATLNGTNGDTAADNTSFWWGTTAAGPFTAAADPSAQVPSGWTNHPTGTGARPIGGSFSYALSGLAASAPQYFVAWSQVGGIWYPGEVLSFTTGTSEAVSHAPTASDGVASLDENTPTDITLTANDEDGNPLTYSVVDSPAHGTATIAGNTATYTPATDYFGGDSFTFKANDGSSDSNTALVTITVREVAPVTHDITASAGANGSITPSGAVSVVDGASQAFTITPDTGFHVADVLVDSASVGAVTSYAFSSTTADHTISASFEADAQAQSFAASSRRNGGSGRILGAATGPGEVKGADTGPAECANGPLITSYMHMGASNDQGQVKLLQAFLMGEMGSTTPVTGLFDAQTDTAVKAFQLKYADDILAPWGLSEPTGWVYLLTQWKINSIACPTIDTPKPSVKWLGQGGMGDGKASTTVASVAGKVVLSGTKGDKNAMGGAGDESQSAAAANASSTPGWFGKFVNWLFGR
jgi:hypothetical protein